MGKWIMEVYCMNPINGIKEWRAVHPSRSSLPYTYDTKQKAYEMLESCYPEQSYPDEVRVTEIRE